MLIVRMKEDTFGTLKTSKTSLRLYNGGNVIPTKGCFGDLITSDYLQNVYDGGGDDGGL